ncbi:MarR family transcriptional regulator [Vibrio cholerae]|jgi:DNA-binding MarR family transcriptional regulator|nr:MarR family transcriptional regulator [Vibrio cholerae]
MEPTDARQGAGYWYPSSGEASVSQESPAVESTGVEVLNALRDYRAVESGLRRRLSQRLSINETDLGALRYLLGVWQRGQEASPKELALALGISSASTTLVIDRLEKAGYIRRRRHPVDRRAVIVEPGEKATEEFRSAFDVEKRSVLAAADGLTNEETETVTRFLRSMEQAISNAVGQPDRTSDVRSERAPEA